jgi:hypothetical protein
MKEWAPNASAWNINPNEFLPTTLVSTDPDADLSELTVPPELSESPYCKLPYRGLKELNDIDLLRPVDTDSYDAVAAIGFVNNRPALLYPEGLRGASSPIREVSSGLRNNQHFIEIWGLDIIPGMSGGALMSGSKLIGISTRFIPFQSTSYFIPLKDVYRFLNAPPKIRERATGSSLARARYYEASFTPDVKHGAREAGDNHHADGGDNHHADGGDNHHADGGSGIDIRFGATAGVGFLREPDEGIPDPENPQLQIIGLGGEQIDGQDDLQRLSVTGNRDFVKRSRDGYPSERIRADLISRLKGKFLGMDRVKMRIFAKDWKNTTGWSETRKGRGTAMIDLRMQGERQFALRLYQDSGLLAPGKYRTEDKVQFIADYEFTGRFDEDFKHVTLTGKDSTMICENIHYLKLICSSANQELSLSFVDRAAGRLKFSYALRGEPEQQGHKTDLIIFMFGEVKKL